MVNSRSDEVTKLFWAGVSHRAATVRRMAYGEKKNHYNCKKICGFSVAVSLNSECLQPADLQKCSCVLLVLQLIFVCMVCKDNEAKFARVLDGLRMHTVILWLFGEKSQLTIFSTSSKLQRRNCAPLRFKWLWSQMVWSRLWRSDRSHFRFILHTQR